jgi:hypothetical protein
LILAVFLVALLAAFWALPVVACGRCKGDGEAQTLIAGPSTYAYYPCKTCNARGRVSLFVAWTH